MSGEPTLVGNGRDLAGQLAIRDGDTILSASGLPIQTAQRIRGLIQVRDTVRCCLRS